VPDIRFISAINKLKLFSKGLDNGNNGNNGNNDVNGDKAEDCYADRKKRSIEITRSLITAPLMSMKFERHKKKDDLADCFLQGMWWLSENYVKAQRSASK